MAQKTIVTKERFEYYHGKNVALMDEKDAAILAESKKYFNDNSDQFDPAGTAQTKVDELANGQVKTNTEAIAKLNGDSSVEGSVDKKVADAINTFATQISDDGTINTYKEILNYISTHGGEAAEMAAAIDALETLVGSKSVATQIADAITAENLAQYATDEELATAIARIVVLEGKAHEHENQDVLDGITEENVAAWSNAETNAKKHADDLNSAMDTRVKVVEEKSTTNTSDITTMKGQIAALEAGTYDDTEVRQLIQANTDAIDAIEGDYLKTADKTALQGNIDVVSAKANENADAIASLEEKVGDGFEEITTEQIDAWFEE